MMDEFLIGIRLRARPTADDYRMTDDIELRVGDSPWSRRQGGTGPASARCGARPAVPDFKRDRLYRRSCGWPPSTRPASWHERRERERRGW